MRDEDIWSDHDPAIRRVRDALERLPPIRRSEAPPEPLPAPEPTRKERLVELLRRLRAGDASAMADLRALVGDAESPVGE